MKMIILIAIININIVYSIHIYVTMSSPTMDDAKDLGRRGRVSVAEKNPAEDVGSHDVSTGFMVKLPLEHHCVMFFFFNPNS